MRNLIFYTAIFLGGLSVFFDNNIIQLTGFAFAYLFVVLGKSNRGFAILAVLISVAILFFDQSGMGSKSVILLYLFYETKKMCIRNRGFLTTDRFRKFSYFLIFVSLPLTLLQIISGEGPTGAFGVIRGSAYFWDPNYLTILLLVLVGILGLRPWVFMTYAVLGQTLTSGIAYFIYRIKPNFNYLLLGAVVILYLVFSLINFEDFSDIPWVSERIYSFSIRVEMLQLYMQGDFLDGAAPHMSLLSGFKKNYVTTIFFFLIIPFLCFDKHRLGMYLVISMTYDVFFGPLCFLVPFAINSKSSFLK